MTGHHFGDGVFVNDAFGTAHRAHASNVGISANVDKAVAGFLLEMKLLTSKAVEAQVSIHKYLGGSKVSDKIGVIKLCLKKLIKFLSVVDDLHILQSTKSIRISNSL